MIRSFNGLTPVIHETAFVSEAAYVIGDVRIGPGASVWPGVVIRADSARIAIGAYSNIQDNSVLHADEDMLIADYVTVGHRVVIHARRVAERCLIGNGAVLNHGVEIGAGSLVASGAVLVEGMSVEPGSLVAGMPARVRGKLKERHRRMMDAALQSYIDRTPLFKAQGDLE